jgi:sugar-specific transcriptional regulator TrmB
MKEILMKIGLSEKEIDFYLLILKHGEITAGKISKISEESRTHTYDTINKLIEKGLVSYVIQNNVKYFKSTNPEKLLDYLKEKEFKLKQEEKEVAKILPEIKKIRSVSEKEDFNIEVYEGKEGIKTVMNDILRDGNDFVSWGASSKVKEYLPNFFIKRYLNERKRKKIHAKQLFTDLNGVLKSPLSKNKKLPKEFASPTTIAVYGNKVSTWFWLEIPKVMVVNNKDLAKSYKKHFELMWKSIN